MSETPSAATESVSDAERAAVAQIGARLAGAGAGPRQPPSSRADNTEAISAVCARLARQGLASLGAMPPKQGCAKSCWCSRSWAAPLARRRSPAPSRPIWRSPTALQRRGAPCWTISIEAKPRSPPRLAEFDGDAAAGRVEWGDGNLSGKISFVEGAETASHFLVFTARAWQSSPRARRACDHNPCPALQCRRSRN